MKGAFDHEYEEAEPTFGQPQPLKPSIGVPDDYPIDAMCPLLKQAARAIIDKVQVPAAIAGQSVLCGAALGVQAHVDVELPTGKSVPTSLFAASVAASGDRKSATDTWALQGVRATEAHMRLDWSERDASYAIDRAAYEAALRSAKTGKKSRAEIGEALRACGDPPKPPIQPILVCEEPTMQALHKAYQEAMPALGLFSDEGAQFVGGYSMSDENRAATGAALSKLWDGAPIKRMRAGEPLSILAGRRLSMHLMFQPGVALKLFGSKELQDQGLLSRLLVCFPTTLKGTRLWRDPMTDSDLDLEKYHARVVTLLCGEMPWPMDAKTRELTPRVMKLSDEARSLAIQWYDAVERAQAPGGEFERIPGFAGKLPEHAIRIAAVMAFFQNKDANKPISATSLAAGIELAKFYAGEALRLFGVGSADADTENADAIIAWIRENNLPTVGGRMLGRYGPGRNLTAPELKRAIQLLIEFGHLKETKGPTRVEYRGKVETQREGYAVIPDGGER